METSALETILKLLPKLDANELQEVKGTANALRLGAEEAREQEHSYSSGKMPPALRVIDEISSTMRERGYIVPGRSTVRSVSHQSAFIHKSEKLDAFLRQQHPESRVRLALLRMGIDMLIDYLAGMPNALPTSYNYVANNVHMIPALFDQSFPGYARARILSVVITREVTPST